METNGLSLCYEYIYIYVQNDSLRQQTRACVKAHKCMPYICVGKTHISVSYLGVETVVCICRHMYTVCSVYIYVKRDVCT